MPPTNPRKRAAPGASPTPPPITQTFPAAAPMSNSDYLRWNQGVDNPAAFPDPTSTFNMNAYNGNNLAAQQATFDQQQAASTQLARRPVNRQLVATAQRYDNGVDNWGQFVDDSMIDPQGVNGPLEESENIELLEERASVAKRDAQSKRKQIPPFVQKLSSFLEESRNTELIRWSDRGDSFVVLDEDEFAKTLIPELFKHNNYASFVRQLNMYGFHKRVGLSDNSMKASERKNKSPSEYYNPFFKRGHPNLLWLINKPKGGTVKGGKKGQKPREETQQERDSDDDGQDIEEIYGNNVPRALSAVPEPSSLQRRDVAVIQNQLMEIQKQQSAITNAISRLRKDHNQLYQQSMAFQTLHDRHENSINAILTFLATVYNRSLDGQGAQNIAQMFQNGIPPEQQQGSVVDVTGQQEPHPGSLSPHRRQQRLLMAPPGQGGRATTTSPSASSTPLPQPQHQAYQSSGAIEELFESPAESSPTPKAETPNPQTNSQQPQNMMNIIHNTNAQTRPNSNNIQFPDMLSHYESSHGRPALTDEQRNSMLNNMMNVNSPPGTAPTNLTNPLLSPSPQPSLEALNLTQAEIDNLMRLQKEQDSRIESIRGIVEPLSPSGSIPGLAGGENGTSYFNGADFGGDGLDMDQYLDGDAWNSSPGVDFGGGVNGVFDSYGNGTAFDDLGLGTGDAGTGVVESLEGSRAQSPDAFGGGGMNGGSVDGLQQQQQQQQQPTRSPSKRRRKN